MPPLLAVRHAVENCYVDLRCVKYLVPHWTKECLCNRESEGKPSCVNCGQDHTANYRGCSKAPKITPKPTNRTDKKILILRFGVPFLTSIPILYL
ncbi:hypothetical protein EVAR_40287_1 [Eumeta japonica]|uniref:Nucleic-acid-binding protein from transposon X-element n=1 Tax=Eumeta variegata TaxID=151549 RepID=A0A4C1WZI7_EUMVA|nr:hypothetical protein EVAR_40287_1 [Eumeta japonica]